MSVLPNEPFASDVSEELEEFKASDKPSLKKLKLRGLLATLAAGNLLLTLLWGSIVSIFLALQAQAIDPKNAATNLALIIGTGAIGSMLAAPIAGTLTDRTRTKLGGRIPWMLAGGAATLVLTVLLAFAHSIPELVVYWTLMQVTTNFILTPLSVHIPDRVPVFRRGTFSAVVGLAQLVGGVAGQSLGAYFASMIEVGYVVVGVLLMIGLVVFAVVNKRSNLGEPKPPLSLPSVLKTFWVNPVEHPNFGWAFLGRFLLMVGYFPLQAFTLYILQDFVGLGQGAIASVPAIGLASMIGTVIGTPLAGWLADRLKASKPIILGASVLMIASFILPLAWPSLTAVLAYSLIAGIGFGGYLAVDYVLITEVLPSAEEAGKDLGIINITTTLPQTIGVAVGGAIVAAFSGYGALFPFAMAFVILGALCLFRIRGVR